MASPADETTDDTMKSTMSYDTLENGIIQLDATQLIPVDEPHVIDVEAVLDESSFVNQADPAAFFEAAQCDEIPFAHASLTEPLLPSADSSPERCAVAVTGTEQQPSIQRPEFLYCKAIKESPESKIGVNFKSSNGGVKISKIAPSSIFHNSGLQVGDRVIAVNNVECIQAKPSKIAEMVRACPRVVSICVRNEGGDARSVLSSIQKPSPTSRVGLAFKPKQGFLTVSKVDNDKGLFARSLVMPDHRCLMLNGRLCTNMTAREAAALVAASKHRVTIISRPQTDLATVLSVGEVQAGWWTNLLMGVGVAAAVSAVSSM